MFKNRLIKIIIALLFLSSIVFIVFNVYTSSKKNSSFQNTDVSNQAVDLSWILPGKTEKNEIISRFGEPNKSVTTATNETLFYNSKISTRNNQIIIEGGIVILVKEMFSYTDEKKISNFSEVYGLPNYSLFGPDSAGGNKLYVYPDKGIAYIGQPKFDALEEVWYFSPTTIDDFKKRLAPNYSEKEILNLY